MPVSKMLINMSVIVIVVVIAIVLLTLVNLESYLYFDSYY